MCAIITARIISEKPIQLDFIFLSARHVFNGNGPACTKQKWNFEKFHEYFTSSHNCFLIRSWNSRNIERFVFFFLYSSLRFFQFTQNFNLWSREILIYENILFILRAFDFRIKKSFKRLISNFSYLIFLLFTIFSFNVTLIFFFFFDSSSFSLSRSLFIFYTYSIVSLSRLLVTKRRRSSWKSALFRRTLTTGNPGNLIHRETKSTISMVGCVLFARISKNSRESTLRNW